MSFVKKVIADNWSSDAEDVIKWGINVQEWASAIENAKTRRAAEDIANDLIAAFNKAQKDQWKFNGDSGDVVDAILNK